MCVHIMYIDCELGLLHKILRKEIRKPIEGHNNSELTVACDHVYFIRCLYCKNLDVASEFSAILSRDSMNLIHRLAIRRD